MSARVRNCWPTGVRLPLIPKGCRATLDRTGTDHSPLAGTWSISGHPDPGRPGRCPPERHGPPAPLPVGRTQTTGAEGCRGPDVGPREGASPGAPVGCPGRDPQDAAGDAADAVTALEPARATRDSPATAARASPAVGNGLVYFLGCPRKKGPGNRVLQCEDFLRRGPAPPSGVHPSSFRRYRTGLSPRPSSGGEGVIAMITSPNLSLVPTPAELAGEVRQDADARPAHLGATRPD